MRTIFNVKFDDIKRLITKDDIEKNKDRMIPLKYYENEWVSEKKRQKFQSLSYMTKSILRYVLFTFGMGLFFLFLQKLQNNKFLIYGSIIYLLLIAYFVYYIFKQKRYKKNYKIIYPYLFLGLMVYTGMLFLFVPLLFFSIFFQIVPEWQQIASIIVYILLVLYVFYKCYSDVYEMIYNSKKQFKNLNKYFNYFLAGGAIFYFVYKYTETSEFVDNTLTLFFFEIVMCLMAYYIVEEPLRYYVQGKYLKKYSEEFRKQFGYTIDEWYGPKSSIGKKLKRMKKSSK